MVLEPDDPHDADVRSPFEALFASGNFPMVDFHLYIKLHHYYL